MKHERYVPDYSKVMNKAIKNEYRKEKTAKRESRALTVCDKRLNSTITEMGALGGINNGKVGPASIVPEGIKLKWTLK